MCAWSQQIRNMSLNAVRRRHPEMSETDIRLKFIELTYGAALAREVCQHLMERHLE
jgi:hypothetical protein